MLPASFRLERLFALHEHRVRALLSSSDCDALTLEDVLGGLDEPTKQAWSTATLGYTESRGLPALRTAIAADYGGVRADEVLAVVPQEGVLLGLSALVEAGTPVIVTTPAYQSLAEIARFGGGVVQGWEPRVVDGSLRFVLDDLEALLATTDPGAPPPLVVVNFPHNPTGAVPTPDEWRGLFALVSARGGRVFSDEMYRHLELDGRAPLPSAVEMSDRAIALSGLSKSLSAPGLRVGWLVTHDAALLADVARRKDWTTICAPGPAELLALGVLGRRRAIEAKNRAIVARNVVAIQAAIAGRPGLRFYPPAGGSVALLRLPDAGAERVAAACDRVLRERDAMLVPASLFENAPGGHFDDCVRLGLGRAALSDDLASVWDLLAGA